MMHFMHLQYAFDKLPHVCEDEGVHQRDVRMYLFFTHMMANKRLEFEKISYSSAKISTEIASIFVSKEEALQELDKSRKIARKKLLHALYPWEEDYMPSPEDDITHSEETKETMVDQFERFRIYKEKYDSKMTLVKFMSDQIYARTDVDWSE